MRQMLLKPIIAHRQKEAAARGERPARSVRRRPGDQPAPQHVVCKDMAVASFLDPNTRTSDPRDRLAVSVSEGRPRRALHDGGDAAAAAVEVDMQHPLMQGLNGGGEGAEQRKQKAWTAVAEGYRTGVSLLCDDDEDYEMMRRCWVKSARLAGEPRLSLAQTPQDRRAL